MPKIAGPYKACSSRDGFYIEGPADGGMCSYHGGTLYPESRFKSLEEANKAAVFANNGFKQGYMQAQLDIQKALGVRNGTT